jgi:hypothetical protein
LQNSLFVSILIHRKFIELKIYFSAPIATWGSVMIKNMNIDLRKHMAFYCHLIQNQLVKEMELYGTKMKITCSD